MKTSIIMVLSALLMGCAQPQHSQALTPSQTSTDRLTTLENKIDRLIEHSRVIEADRAEVLKFNQCAGDCSTIRLEQPTGLTKSERERWYDRADVVDANKRANECYKRCDLLKPKSQPDWSC